MSSPTNRRILSSTCKHPDCLRSITSPYCLEPQPISLEQDAHPPFSPAFLEQQLHRANAARAISMSQSSPDTTLTNQQAFQRPPSPRHHPYMSSPFSLRNNPTIDTDAPVWTHTSNPAVNHEIDSLKIIWYTLKDVGTETGSESRLASNNELIFEHIRKRVAIIRIGAIKGWRAVPNSEVQQDFQALGIEAMAAAQLAIAPTSHSFRGSSSGRGRRRSNKTTKK